MAPEDVAQPGPLAPPVPPEQRKGLCAHSDRGSFEIVQASLSGLDNQLLRMHQGGHYALLDESNPDALAQSAHSFRELAEKLPRHFHIAQEIEGGTPDEHARNLEKGWDVAKAKSGAYSKATGAWGGLVDPELNNLLQLVELLVLARRMHAPAKRVLEHLALNALDSTRQRLPPTLEDKRLAQWKGLHKRFLSICHHGETPTRKELIALAQRFDQFVASLIRPQTAADFTAIDELLAAPD